MWKKRKPASRQHKQSDYHYDREGEAALARRACNDNELAARNKLVERYKGLVKRMALSFVRYGAAREDLEQEGYLALMRAAESYEPDRDLLFGTYAAYWVRAYMQRYLASDLSYRYSAPRSVAFDTGRRGRTRKQRSLQLVTSLNEPRGEDNPRPLMEELASDTANPEQAVERRQVHEVVRSALNQAIEEMSDDRAKVLLEQRLLTDTPQTLAKIGKQLNLSREGARLLESRLLKRAQAALCL